MADPQATSSQADLGSVQLHDRVAREVLLLRAFESQNTDAHESPLWTRADAQWATRVASESVTAQAKPAAFLEARAHAAMQRLAPRDEGVRQVLAMRGWRWAWLPWTALVAAVLGAVIYDVASHQRIDLLSVPVWGVVIWNLLVYGWLLWQALRGSATRTVQTGRLHRFLGGRLAAKVSGITRKTPALANFASAWSRVAWPMTVARAGAVLHVGAAALAMGLIAGMYLRGLVLDYRAGWQSTFLEPSTVHALLSRALAPASSLTGVPLPDVAGVAALRVLPGQEAVGVAAPWIHWMAATLLLWVVLPRLALAAISLARGAWLSRRIAIDLGDPYHQRLLQQHRGQAAQVRVHPHGVTPDAQAALGLQRLVAKVYGDGVGLAIAPMAHYGGEDADVIASALDSDTVKLALFDLTATPEVEAQGRFIQALRQRAGKGGTVLVVVDEAAFNSRFADQRERGDQRRAAWQAWCAKLAMPAPVFLSLHALDSAAALQAAAEAVEARAQQFAVQTV